MNQHDSAAAVQSGRRATVILSFLIGALVGLVVVAFILVTGRLAARMYPAGSPAWRRVLTPIAGALVSGYLLSRYFPDARGSGIPQTKFAIFIYNGYISLKTVLGKLLCCSIALASGIALGREGPSAQVGAGLASVLVRRFGLSDAQVKGLVPAGAAAALAAAFNTPIAAVLFSLEEVLGDLHAPVIGSIVISSATSWMVLHLILGDEPLFHVPAYQLVNPIEFAIYGVLGVAGGLASVCFVKLLLNLRIWFRKLPAWSAWFQPAAGGAVAGILALFAPAVLGVGYEYIERVLVGEFTLNVLLLLFVLKMIATAVCYSSGNAGGIFGPSLFMGAMIGGAAGSLAHQLLPQLTAGPGAYALVGMGAAFAGIVRTPLTSVLMIFELTRDYSIIVPLMISNLISFFVSQRLQRVPIYEALAQQEGVRLPSDEMREQMERLQIGRVMRPAEPVLSPDETVEFARSQMQATKLRALPVVENGSMWALLTAAQLEQGAQGDRPIREVVNPTDSFAHAHIDEPLTLALEQMGAAGLDILHVVSRANARQLLGVVTLPEVLEAYGIGGAPTR